MAGAVAGGLALSIPALFASLRERRPAGALVSLCAVALFGRIAVIVSEVGSGVMFAIGQSGRRLPERRPVASCSVNVQGQPISIKPLLTVVAGTDHAASNPPADAVSSAAVSRRRSGVFTEYSEY